MIRTNEANDEFVLGRLRAQRLYLLNGEWEGVKYLSKFALKYKMRGQSSWATDFWEKTQHGLSDDVKRRGQEFSYLLEHLDMAIAVQRLTSALEEFEEDLAHVSNEQLGAYIRENLLEWAHMGFEGAESDGFGDSMAAVLRDITAGLKTYNKVELQKLESD